MRWTVSVGDSAPPDQRVVETVARGNWIDACGAGLVEAAAGCGRVCSLATRSAVSDLRPPNEQAITRVVPGCLFRQGALRDGCSGVRCVHRRSARRPAPRSSARRACRALTEPRLGPAACPVSAPARPGPVQRGKRRQIGPRKPGQIRSKSLLNQTPISPDPGPENAARPLVVVSRGSSRTRSSRSKRVKSTGRRAAFRHGSAPRLWAGPVPQPRVSRRGCIASRARIRQSQGSTRHASELYREAGPP